MHSNKPLIKNNLINLRRTNLVACSLQIGFRFPLTNFGGKYNCKAKLCNWNPSNKSYICKKETKIYLYESNGLAKNLTVSLSGGQDSSFLLFYVSLLQAQLSFNCNNIWCNHFWQIDSFYTTLHLTKYALGFSSPIVGFLPFQLISCPWFYKIVATKYKKTINLKSYKKKQSATNIVFLKQNFLSQRYLSLRLLSLHYRVEACKMNQIKTNCSSYRDFFVFSNEHFYNDKISQLLTPRLSLQTKQNFVNRRCPPPKVINRLLQIVALHLTPKLTWWGRCYKSKPFTVRCGAGCTPYLLCAYAQYRTVCKALHDATKPFTVRCGAGCTPYLQSKALHDATKICTCHQNLYSPRSNVNFKKPKAYKKAIKKLSETRARNWRHIATERGCTFYDSNKCVYGHTLSDRVETILFNLIRGTGGKGVQSLPFKRRYSTFCYNKFYPVLEQVIKNTHIDLV